MCDRNHDGFIDASESDPGEDYDRDGKFTTCSRTFSTTTASSPIPAEDNPYSADAGDARLTASGVGGGPGGCEGVHR